MATYAIGDVHGCLEPLEHLWRTLPFEASRDAVWLTGDLVARGPDSAGVLRWARGAAERLGGRFVSVLGNHDLRLLAARAGIDVGRGPRVLADVLASPDGEDLLAWLAARPVAHLGGEKLLVHAGVLPSWGLAEILERAHAAEEALRGPRAPRLLAALEGREPAGALAAEVGTLRVVTRVRTLSPNGELSDDTGPPESAPTGYRPWFAGSHRRPDGLVVVCGHWASLGLRLQEGLVALDTGCVYGGPLTAVRLDDRKVFQVPGRARSPRPASDR